MTWGPATDGGLAGPLPDAMDGGRKPRREHADFEGHKGCGYAVCPITVAGRQLLASGGDDGTVRIWDSPPEEQNSILEGHPAGSAACARSPRRPAAAGQRRRRRHGADVGPRNRPAAHHPGRPPRRVGGGGTVTGRQPRLASAGDDGTVRIWDPATGKQRATLEGHTGCVGAWRGRRRTAAAGQRRRRRHGADLGPRHRQAAHHPGRPHRAGDGVCAFTGRTAPAGQRRRRRHGADLGPRHRQAAHHPDGHTGGGLGVCASPGRQHPLASAGSDGTVRIWDPATGSQRTTLAGHTGRVVGVWPHPGRAAAGWPAAATTARCGSGTPPPAQQRTTLEGHTGRSTACALTPDGTRLASAGDDGTVRIWDPATGKQRATLAGHHGGVNGVCAGHRGRPAPAGQRRRRRHGADLGPRHRPAARRPGGPHRLVSGVCAGHRGRPAPAGQRRRRRHGADLGPRHRPAARRPGRPHRRGSGVCAVTVAGRHRLASAGDDGTVRIWDPATGKQRATLEGHPGRSSGGGAVTLDGQHRWPAPAATARYGSGTSPPAQQRAT